MFSTSRLLHSARIGSLLTFLRKWRFLLPKLTFFRRWRFFFTPGGPKLTCFDPKKSPLLTGNPTNHLDVYIFSSFGSIFSPLVSIFNLTNRQRHCWERFSDLVTLIVTLTVNDWQTERGMDSIRNYCDVFPQNTLRISRNILSFVEYYSPIVFINLAHWPWHLQRCSSS